jgi:tricorn protease-like protein
MRGYYMFPDIYGDDIIFVTEDDLWKFSRGVGSDSPRTSALWLGRSFRQMAGG